MKQKTDPRHKARKIALKKLFWYFETKPINKDNNTSICFPKYKNPVKDLTKNIVDGVIKSQAKLDKMIEKASPEWDIDMMAAVDLQIIRIAVYEGFLEAFTPPKVAVDEAVELAKEYGGEDSPKFVNGVLGAIIRYFSPKEKQDVEKKDK